MSKTLMVLLLSLAVRGCDSRSSQTPQQTPPSIPSEATDERPSGKAQETRGAVVLHSDDAEIMVFPACAGPVDQRTGRKEYCPIAVVYELRRSLSEGSLQVFNDLKVDAEYPLPELSAGKHITTLPNSFYWQEREETLPDETISFSLGTVPTSFSAGELWGADSGQSVYDYKPGPLPERERNPPPDEAAQFRGDDVGFSSMYIPAKHNRELLDSGGLPEIEILGVGFDNGTYVQF